MNEQEKYENLRLYIKQQIKEAESILASEGGDIEKVSRQLQIHFLFQVLDKMDQLDNDV